eukprot:CAMPEP_0117696366 /NCGR_PEP_ID=MMETSP0804-20121206/28642_1 /TAXON_ID=1074897 /ORGANISM="Tetraselmis astigmatica, Strain CCMP880" /LENGTH=59 /DNA_ID=CAMNT_0005510515 /DNA_START=111 /DNA_END=291 /DNA_ORIENTATION=-
MRKDKDEIKRQQQRAQTTPERRQAGGHAFTQLQGSFRRSLGMSSSTTSPSPGPPTELTG